MNRHFKFAHSMAAGQIAYRIPGQEQDHSSFSRCRAQLAKSVLLVGRQPVFQKINVVWHSVPCFRRLQPLPGNPLQVPDAVTLTAQMAEAAKQYIRSEERRVGEECR